MGRVLETTAGVVAVGSILMTAVFVTCMFFGVTPFAPVDAGASTGLEARIEALETAVASYETPYVTLQDADGKVVGKYTLADIVQQVERLTARVNELAASKSDHGATEGTEKKDGKK